MQLAFQLPEPLHACSGLFENSVAGHVALTAARAHNLAYFKYQRGQ